MSIDLALIITLHAEDAAVDGPRQLSEHVQEDIAMSFGVEKVRFVKLWETGIDVHVETDERNHDTITLECRS